MSLPLNIGNQCLPPPPRLLSSPILSPLAPSSLTPPPPRHLTNAVEEMWREVEVEVCELREDFEAGNAERVARYEAQMADWKAHQKARVSGVTTGNVM